MNERPLRLLARLAAALLAGAVLFLALPRTARATDYYLEGSASGGASEWGKDDPNIQGALHTGFEFIDIVSVDVLMRMGYAAIDERMLMTLGLGTKIALPFERFIPYLRVTAIHSHEMSVAAMDHDLFSHLMGVGDGIRHRFGVEGALGLSVLFAKFRKSRFYAEAEGYADGFPDDRGPKVYGGGGLGLEVQVGL